ncbi:MAG: endolytic transglycosylase MltG, partial [Armatimonadetes bacterium]|nr:endolytic transglycosylase MltG [Armatimonadota bacterium]
AAVIFNRLRRNMRLEVDATLLYALGRQRFIDFARDKKVDSPYNTYRCYGLPPGPICNPGLDSIRAVLSPAQVGYLYYVAQANGVHVFAYTYAEHRENCRRVREGQSSG